MPSDFKASRSSVSALVNALIACSSETLLKLATSIASLIIFSERTSAWSLANPSGLSVSPTVHAYLMSSVLDLQTAFPIFVNEENACSSTPLKTVLNLLSNSSMSDPNHSNLFQNAKIVVTAKTEAIVFLSFLKAFQIFEAPLVVFLVNHFSTVSPVSLKSFLICLVTSARLSGVILTFSSHMSDMVI